MKIAFLGAGTMGRPMLANLIKKGHSVVAYDIVPEALSAAVALGAGAAGSAAEATAQGEAVIAMLPSSSHVVSAFLGDGGVMAAVRSGQLCIDMSTIDPSTSRMVAGKVRERGARFIDAPVSGGVPRAEDGTLAIMVGGDPRDVERGQSSRAWARTSSTWGQWAAARWPSSATT